MYYIFFFFKQKTAYEMRISDWSSDVCSSDLIIPAVVNAFPDRPVILLAARPVGGDVDRIPGLVVELLRRQYAQRIGRLPFVDDAAEIRIAEQFGLAGVDRAGIPLPHTVMRSEEHTSELQSLIRNSYAVFCLKKN